jgi:hypothetical protein
MQIKPKLDAFEEILSKINEKVLDGKEAESLLNNSYNKSFF